MFRFVFSLIAIFLVVSCNKQQAGVALKDMEISGFVFDSTHQSGAANVRINAYWQDSAMLQTPIATTVTDPQGKFRLKMSVDAGKFMGAKIIVSLFAPENYISYGHPQVQEAQPIRYYAAQAVVQRFVLFEKTHVTISFRRMQSDSIKDFQSNYSFYEGDTHDLLQFTNAIATPIAISYIDKETAVGVYTKLSWIKTLASGATVIHKDSIFCRANASNAMVVDF